VQDGQLHLWGSGNPRTTPPMQRKTMILDREKHWFLLPDKPFEDLLGLEDWITVGTTFGLTARELDVVILLFEDCTRQTICRRLHRGEASVRKRIDKVFRKMNVKDRLGLVQRIWHVHRALQSWGHKDAPCQVGAAP